MTDKFVYSFEEGRGEDRSLLGGKGAGLCEMTRMGLAVPPGFVITTETCRRFLEDNRLPAGLVNEVHEHVAGLERSTGRLLGGGKRPLLVSVRSGAAVSMPGMMDTILNLGLNRTTVRALYRETGDARFAFDAQRRFLEFFSTVVLDLPRETFRERTADLVRRHGRSTVEELDAAQLQELAQEFREAAESWTGWAFPEDPYVQLELAIRAVFKSWLGRRAVDYRRRFGITADVADGTAATVCAMVFGNLGDDSGTGVGFTRDPATGERGVYGEFLTNAQGEDLVAGVRTPASLEELRTVMPGVHEELLGLAEALERRFGEVQDFEFTVERGRLFCLQTRAAKMNSAAVVRTSVEMTRERLIDRRQAVLRPDPDTLDQLLVPQVSGDVLQTPLAVGLSASPGAVSGRIALDADSAVARADAGQEVILVRAETRPEDIHGFFAAKGILTARGGRTSHAAVVARGMGKPCVCGCDDVDTDAGPGRVTIGDATLNEGDLITIDGTTGRVYAGRVPTRSAEPSAELAEVLAWADQYSSLEVRANADTPEDARRARELGARGIGLCRTERMFNAPDRLPLVQRLILAETDQDRAGALEALLPAQRSDFELIFKAMEGLPVTVRLLDAPLHEFLPHAYELEHAISSLGLLRTLPSELHELPDAIRQLDPELHGRIAELIQEIGSDLVELAEAHPIDALIDVKRAELKRVLSLAEVNPMLGHRGVRLGLTFPEIYRMQIRGIIEAAAACVAEGVDAQPEILVPQVVTAEELRRVHTWVGEIRSEVEAATGVEVRLKFGSMVETVRACMRAPRLAEVAEFFSFGTNDLTQAVFSFSREDVETKFLPLYNETGILRDNPFEVLDVEGVGRLLEMTVESVQERRPGTAFGVCGEQGGHPASIAFCHRAGLDYVSCSPSRIPAARLAAAQAALREEHRASSREAA